jgi:hypothetical protein
MKINTQNQFAVSHAMIFLPPFVVPLLVKT